jgi:hypothetical protein
MAWALPAQHGGLGTLKDIVNLKDLAMCLTVVKARFGIVIP